MWVTGLTNVIGLKFVTHPHPVCKGGQVSADGKARFARILGYVCIAVGALNVVLVAVGVARGEALLRSPLLITGIVALMMGIFMLALGKRKPSPDG